jgi:hypothetical protein
VPGPRERRTKKRRRGGGVRHPRRAPSTTAGPAGAGSVLAALSSAAGDVGFRMPAVSSGGGVSGAPAGCVLPTLSSHQLLLAHARDSVTSTGRMLAAGASKPPGPSAGHSGPGGHVAWDSSRRVASYAVGGAAAASVPRARGVASTSSAAAVPTAAAGRVLLVTPATRQIPAAVGSHFSTASQAGGVPVVSVATATGFLGAGRGVWGNAVGSSSAAAYYYLPPPQILRSPTDPVWPAMPSAAVPAPVALLWPVPADPTSNLVREGGWVPDPNPIVIPSARWPASVVSPTVRSQAGGVSARSATGGVPAWPLGSVSDSDGAAMVTVTDSAAAATSAAAGVPALSQAGATTGSAAQRPSARAS